MVEEVEMVVVEWFGQADHDVFWCDVATNQHRYLLLREDTRHVMLLVSFLRRILLKNWTL